MNDKPPFRLLLKVLFRYLSALIIFAGLVMGWSTNAAAYTDDEDPTSSRPSILNSGILTVGDDTSDNYLNIGGEGRYATIYTWKIMAEQLVKATVNSPSICGA